MNALTRLPRRVFMAPVRAYRRWISPLTSPRCKFYPTCSTYALEALEVHGATKGTVMAVWRVLRCNPFSHGGVDDVPRPGERLLRLRRNNGDMMSPYSSDQSVA